MKKVNNNSGFIFCCTILILLVGFFFGGLVMGRYIKFKETKEKELINEEYFIAYQNEDYSIIINTRDNSIYKAKVDEIERIIIVEVLYGGNAA